MTDGTGQGCVLYGYRYSVYTRIIRMVLIVKDVAHGYRELDPFAPGDRDALLPLHPFGRVPVFEHDGFRLYETAVIANYLDDVFPEPMLRHRSARERARAAQIVAVIDNYGNWPMIRQVFSNAVFKPAFGEAGDEGEILKGLAASRAVLGALEAIAEGGDHLVGDRRSLADLHAAAMFDYFCRYPPAREALGEFDRLGRWWSRMEDDAVLRTSDPELPSGRQRPARR